MYRTDEDIETADGIKGEVESACDSEFAEAPDVERDTLHLEQMDSAEMSRFIDETERFYEPVETGDGTLLYQVDGFYYDGTSYDTTVVSGPDSETLTVSFTRDDGAIGKCIYAEYSNDNVTTLREITISTEGSDASQTETVNTNWTVTEDGETTTKVEMEKTTEIVDGEKVSSHERVVTTTDNYEGHIEKETNTDITYKDGEIVEVHTISETEIYGEGTLIREERTDTTTDNGTKTETVLQEYERNADGTNVLIAETSIERHYDSEGRETERMTTIKENGETVIEKREFQYDTDSGDCIESVYNIDPETGEMIMIEENEYADKDIERYSPPTNDGVVDQIREELSPDSEDPGDKEDPGDDEDSYPDSCDEKPDE
jgi:hypothetical protein